MALLGLLDRDPSHGYDLKRDYDTYFGRGRPLPFGQAYAPSPVSPGMERQWSAKLSPAPVLIASATRSPKPEERG